MITAEQIAEALACPVERAKKWVDALNAAMARYEINTPVRQAAFLAQVGHESGRLIYVREIWNPAQCPWQAKYEGRADLGNTVAGDGVKYKGRGLIQITGRANYKACGDALGIDCLNSPELLEQIGNAAMSAAWFWKTHGLNELADAGDFKAITKRINGGYNGQDDRVALLDSATEALA